MTDWNSTNSNHDSRSSTKTEKSDIDSEKAKANIRELEGQLLNGLQEGDELTRYQKGVRDACQHAVVMIKSMEVKDD